MSLGELQVQSESVDHCSRTNQRCQRAQLVAVMLFLLINLAVLSAKEPPFGPQEEELRKSGEAKYAHLSNDLHVLIEVFAPPGEAYSRMSHALEEIKKFLVPVSLMLDLIFYSCVTLISHCFHLDHFSTRSKTK